MSIKLIEAAEYKNYFNHRSAAKVTPEISETVRKIIDDVKNRGDEAVKYYEKKFDNTELSALEVNQNEIETALSSAGSEYISMLERAAKNIADFHKRQLREGFMYTSENGIILGQRVLPIENAGLYIPGGKASYPSSVLMNAIPAKIAGCKNIIMVSPPPIRPEVIAAAKISGVTRIFKAGGAQAVAALAYGTESIPKADKITGPGNVYVAEAKRQVFGIVDIDMIAGPSEILIIADKNNNAAHLASDMLAQSEHDPDASAILITNSRELAENVISEIEKQILILERHEIARKSIDNNGLIIIAENREQAVNTANDIAPEHLELCVENPFGWLTEIKNAGSVFLGSYSPEALGDYYAGINHTLPTMGTAIFSSPLSVDDFIKKSQYVYYTEAALKNVSDDIETFAKSEGLTGHANSITIRTK